MSNKTSRLYPVYVAAASKPDVEAFIAAAKLDENNETLARELRRYMTRVIETA